MARARLRRAWWELYIAVLLAAVLLSCFAWRSLGGAELRFRPVSQRSFESVPVVFVVFDELPLASLMDESGGIDQELFPNFARLQRHSHWFRNATTIAPFTSEALPAILTGRYPDSSLAVKARNLFSLVAGTHDIKVAEALPRYCPADICVPPDAELAAPAEATELDAFASGARGVTFLSFLERIDRCNKTTFHFMHLSMPHVPWIFLPSGRQYSQPPDAPGEVDIPGPGRAWGDRPWLVTQVYQRHLLQVGLVDRLLGMTIDELTEKGLYQRSLVVITADHGVAFEPEAPKRRIRASTAPGVAPVPLFVKRPFQDRGRIVNRPVETVDILPTIADVLDLAYVWPDIDGVSVFERAAYHDRRRRIGSVHLTAAGREKSEAVESKYRRFGDDGAIDLYDVAPYDLEHSLKREVGTFPVASDDSSPLLSATLLQRKARVLPIVRGQLSGVRQVMTSRWPPPSTNGSSASRGPTTEKTASTFIS